ncbi:exosortase/archaeosortase family protein [Nibricoccus sp. IMCC34717]|uniref:exosortase/archaeosortase family protein n=1 Tax=Nibricoccus sp. IMCC34717 TaxID=3034021 RepID=UPI00384BCD2D
MPPVSESKALPRSLLVTLGCLALPLLFVTYDQSFWWREKEDYGFGWLAPLFVLYVINERWPTLRALFSEPRFEPSRRTLSLSAAWCSFALSLAFFCCGALYRAAAGISYGGTLAITLGASGIVFSGLWVSGLAHHLKSPLKPAVLMLFPALIWIVSAPMLTVIESNLSTTLRSEITHIVFGFYDLLGFPIEQRGNVLVLPSGQVGVEEACSGIRSLTGCLFAGSFLAATFTQRIWSKVLLVVLSLLLAFFSNLLRSLFLTGWAIRHGSHSIEGTVHDVSGYAVLGVTVGALLLVLPLLEKRSPQSAA